MFAVLTKKQLLLIPPEEIEGSLYVMETKYFEIWLLQRNRVGRDVE